MSDESSDQISNVKSTESTYRTDRPVMASSPIRASVADREGRGGPMLSKGLQCCKVQCLLFTLERNTRQQAVPP